MVRPFPGIASAVFAAAMLLGVASAAAQTDVMKACGAEWQAAKTAGKVKPGETWKSFLADCRKAKAAAKADDDAVPPEPTKTTTPDKPIVPAKPVSATDKPPTPGQVAARERIKKCGAEWSAAKEAGKLPAGQKWPQYWSDCNKRLKAAGQ